MKVTSWRNYIKDDEIQAAQSKTPEITDFGQGQGIILGLRFGEGTKTSKFDGDESEIWCPVTPIVMDGWNKYYDLLNLSSLVNVSEVEEGKKLPEAERNLLNKLAGVKLKRLFEPEYVQIDDEEWSLVFTFPTYLADSVEDFVDFLMNYYLYTRNCSFSFWIKEFYDLDEKYNLQIGVKESSFRKPKATWKQSKDLEARETPLKHHSDGRLEHLKKRAFGDCKICKFQAHIWCTDDQAAEIDSIRFGNGKWSGLLELLPSWDAIALGSAVHPWCLAKAFEGKERQDLKKRLIAEINEN